MWTIFSIYSAPQRNKNFTLGGEVLFFSSFILQQSQNPVFMYVSFSLFIVHTQFVTVLPQSLQNVKIPTHTKVTALYWGQPGVYQLVSSVGWSVVLSVIILFMSTLSITILSVYSRGHRDANIWKNTPVTSHGYGSQRSRTVAIKYPWLTSRTVADVS